MLNWSIRSKKYTRKAQNIFLAFYTSFQSLETNSSSSDQEGVMSKIPRPSPRTFRDLPITDDAKRAAIPKKAARRPKEENKQKQLEKAAPSNAAIPSTSKESAKSSKARQRELGNHLNKATISNVALPSTSKESTSSLKSTVDRQHGTLKRSKTQPEIERDHVTIQANGRITRSQANKATNLQPAVHSVKKGEVPKGAAKLRQRLTFRDKKSTIKPKREQSPSNSKKQLEKVASSDAAIPSTSKASAVSLECTMIRKCDTLNRSKTESAIELDHVSIRRNGRITTSQAKQATNPQPAVHGIKKDEVPKGAAKLKQRLSFRDKNSNGISKIKSNTGNANNVSKALKTRTAEPFKFRSHQTLNRSKTESSINLEKFTKRTRANKTTQINQASKEKGKQVKPLDNQGDIFPELFKDNTPNGSPLQAEFCSPREVAHSGMKFIAKPRKKSMSLNFKLTRSSPSQTSNGDHDSPDKLSKEEPAKNV